GSRSQSYHGKHRTSTPTAVITAEAVSETRSKKHTPATMAKDKNRARRKLVRLLPGILTPQMVLSASCNWPNTPLAPKSATAIPTTAATALAVGLPALAAMSSTALALLRSRKE